MAKAPIYTPGSVKARPMPGPRFTAGATAASFGGTQARQIGAFGAALEEVGDLASAMVLKSQEKKNKALARDNFNKARGEYREWLSSDVYNKKGEEAINSYEEAEKKSNDLRRVYNDKLIGDRQKELFNASFDSLTASHLLRVLGFQEQQKVVFEKATLDAENLQAIDDAVAARTDINEIKSAEQDIVANTKYSLKGFPGPVKEKAVADAVNNLYNTVLTALISDSPGAASAFFEKNIEKFNPKLQAQISANLRKLTDAEAVRNIAMTLANSDLPLEDQLKEVDKIKDPKIAAQVRSQVKVRFNEKVTISNAKSKEVIADEWATLMRAPAAYDIPNNMPVEIADKMRKYKTKAVEEAAAQSGEGPAPVTNWIRYDELMTLPPDELSKVDLAKELDSLALPEFKKLMDLQRNSRYGGTKGASTDRVRTVQQQATQSIIGFKDMDVSANVKKDKRKREHAIRRNRYFEQFEKGVQLIPENERTSEKVGELINRLLAPAEITRFGPIPNKNVYQFELPYIEHDDSEEEAELFLDNIPENLKVYRKELQYDAETDRYFVEGDGVVDIFDRYGTPLKRAVRIIE